MFYAFAVTVPARTTENDPLTRVLKLTDGIIHHVEIEFPAGCGGLAHCQLFHGGHQVYPTNPEGSFASDGRAIVFADYYELVSAPYALKAVTWNKDDTFEHEVTIRLGLLPAEVLQPPREEVSMIRRIYNLLFRP